ncbi:MAG: serine hydrolase [Acidithiobacillales bacterium]
MRRRVRFAALALLLAPALLSDLSRGATGNAPVSPAVVAAGTENLYVRPDETGPVESQVILGERVEVLEGTAGFARVRTRDGTVAWIPERSLRRSDVSPAARAKVARVTSNFAHVYSSPSFTKARPLLSAPLGATMRFSELLEGHGGDSYPWVRVALPDGREGFVAARDVALLPFDENPPLQSPSSWVSFGERFLGAPYTWGGTTPAGFDCSGLVQLVFRSHGVLLKRDSFEQAFQEPQLVPVSPDALLPGDLLFFGTADKIDHEAIWIGNGTVLESTRHGVPGVKVTPLNAPYLRPLLRYARRLALLPEAPKPGRPDPTKVAALRAKLEEIAAASGARFGIVFKDLSTGESVRIGADRVMHAASTMKTPVMLEILRRVDAGTMKLTDELPVRNEFRSAVDGSSFSIGLDPETDGPTMAHLGKSAPVGFLVKEMIDRSSNLAANVLLSHATPEAVQAFTDCLGAPTVKVRRCLEDIKAFDKGLNNETDAAGMATVMEAAVRTPLLSPAARAMAWEILTAQTFNDQIPAGLHPQSGAVVGHKTGSISTVQHDAAVVRLPDGREYVLVLLANDFGTSEEGREKVKEASRRMSRAVWEEMIAP